jgi:signal transduction histidine kinase
MGRRSWQQVALGLTLVALVATLVLSYPLAGHLEWRGNATWQLVYDLVGAAIAMEVAAFALSRFGLERRRLPMFIGIAYLGAGIADLVAALVAQGNYILPLVRHTEAVVAVWTAGRVWLAGCLLAGLFMQRVAPVAPSARLELMPAALIGGCVSFALVQLSQMVPLPWLLADADDSLIWRPWELAVAVLLVLALPAFWREYRRVGGSMIGSVLVSLVVALFAQGYMAQSKALYDGNWNLATALKIASYLPLLVGLFVESVTLFRAQRKLTGELQVAQAELSEYSRELERKVADRTRALETRAKDLEAFAYTVSHDLKGPLRGVQTYSSLLLESAGDKLDETGRRYAQSVARAAVQMKQLIDDLLEYSRMERREANMTPVDLRALTESVVADRQVQIEQGNVRVEIDFALPAVVGDRAMLREALANLVDNAIKYSRDARPPQITVRGREENGQFVVTVRDNGIGFDMQHEKRIFEIFQRLVRADEFEGTGIGLSIVKRAVEKHGGNVRAESTPGQGSTFTIILPKGKSRA